MDDAPAYVADLVELHAERILRAAGASLAERAAGERRLILSLVLDCYEAGVHAGTAGVLTQARLRLG